jgi:multimeric flavodoxin WrbA
MNILILNSSYRKEGNTDRTAQLLQARLQSTARDNHEPLVVDTLYLGHMNIEPCRGCRVCFDKGEEFCPIKDDMAEIKARMQAADALILAGPVYVDDVNGIMKNWIDRLAHVCHRPEFAGKSAYLVVTVGSTRMSHALRTMDTALRTWGFYIIGKDGFKTHARMEKEQIEKLYGERLTAIAENIFLCVKGEHYKEVSFVSLMMFKIQQVGWSKARRGSIDYQYWKSKGWLDGKQQFFIKPKANGLKIAAARLTGAVIAKFMV